MKIFARVHLYYIIIKSSEEKGNVKQLHLLRTLEITNGILNPKLTKLV